MPLLESGFSTFESVNYYYLKKPFSAKYSLSHQKVQSYRVYNYFNEQRGILFVDKAKKC